MAYRSEVQKGQRVARAGVRVVAAPVLRSVRLAGEEVTGEAKDQDFGFRCGAS